MNHDELILEIRRLNVLAKETADRAAAQVVIIDKLTALNLKVQALLARLEAAAVRSPEGS